MIRNTVAVCAGCVALWATLIFCWLNVCGPLWYRWYASDYIHGYAVVPFALFLLWYRRDRMPRLPGPVEVAGEVGTEQTSVTTAVAAEPVKDSALHGTMTRTRKSLWSERLVQAMAILLFSAAVQIAGQIIYYRVETLSQVVARNMVVADTAAGTDAANEDSGDGVKAGNVSEPDEISVPVDLADVLKYGVPGVAVRTDREQILENVREHDGVNAFQRGFVRWYGDWITLVLGWIGFASAVFVMMLPDRTGKGTESVPAGWKLVQWLCAYRPSKWVVLWGVVFLLVGGACQVAGAFLSDPVLYPASIVPVLFGAMLLLGGFPMLRWTWPSIVFLIFMVPLPELLGIMFADRLQMIGTVASVWLLQLGGVAADAAGNVISLPNGQQMGVIEACSGLKMLVLFFCICTAGMFLMRGGVVEKTVVFLSAIPIAMLANIARITITGFLYMTNAEMANRFFHDGAGAFMAPLAMLLLWGEIELMGILLIPVESAAVAGGAEGANAVADGVAADAAVPKQ